MGQKINPILFRLGSQENSSSLISPCRKSHISHFLVQDIECKKFLFALLRSRGIFPRTCIIHRTPEKLSVHLDLYFTSLFFKSSKLFWVRSFFKNMKKKYRVLRKIKDLKDFLQKSQAIDERLEENSLFFTKKKYLLRNEKKNKTFYLKSKKLDDFDLIYKRRLFYFLFYQKRKNVLEKAKDKQSIYSLQQNNVKSGSNLVRMNISKFTRLFNLRKLKYRYSHLFLNNFFFPKKVDNNNLLVLNKFMCQSLQKYSGMEQITITLCSTQLLFLPTFKVYKKLLMRELSTFRRSRDVKKYFLESLEMLYFVLGSYGKGNAFLLAKFIVHFLEKNRKQLSIVKFLKKGLQVFFKKLPKTFLSVEGIRILIKGRFNKRRRSKKIVLSEGEISLQTLDTCIDYFQTHAVTIYGSFGVKVWIAKRNYSS